MGRNAIVPAQVTEDCGHSAPVEAAWEPHTRLNGNGWAWRLWAASTFPNSMSKGPGSLPPPCGGVAGAISTCRAVHTLSFK